MFFLQNSKEKTEKLTQETEDRGGRVSSFLTGTWLESDWLAEQGKG